MVNILLTLIIFFMSINFNIFGILAEEYGMRMDVGKVVKTHTKNFLVDVELNNREGILEEVKIVGSYKPNNGALGLLLYSGNFMYPHFLPLYSGENSNIKYGDSYTSTIKKEETVIKKDTIITSDMTNVKNKLKEDGVKIYVFGDSHIKGALGTHMGTNFKNINSSSVYKSFGVNSAGFTNKYMGEKSTLLNSIKTFNPDLIFCFLGTNEIANNKSGYKNLVNSANNFFNSDFDGYNIVIITTPYYNESGAENVAEGLQKFASNKGYGFVNIFESDMIAPHTDKWHFTNEGYRLIAGYITSQLK